MKTYGYAAVEQGTPLVPFTFERRESNGDDVTIEILYSGVCHSDLHMAKNDWGRTVYPLVPGHEIVGKVIAIGRDVTKFKIGDHVAVGTFIDSCMACDQCQKGEEHMCREILTETYNGQDRVTGENTYGGYAKHIVVKEHFVLSIPDRLDISRAAPLLCAGITTYSPLRTWNVGPGTRVGIIGLGGLGHMAVKLAVGLGADVTVLSRSKSKETDALQLGAHHLLDTSDEAAMQQALNGFDVILDTVPVKHDINPYIPLLDIDGTFVVVGQLGLLDEPFTVPMIMGRRRIAGSMIGGIAETQEMLNFCARQNILPDCEMIRMDQINEAFERLERSDVRYRFVIDMSPL
ncbi:MULTISPECIES: NAD(P)-dependent alcohol dehydrogenase [Acinetobacter]|uniref:NAD(P)-dependent alcohol dehydrogenase n=1 Tax=Acinetobacter TaxID=469 RepID=UPI00044D5BE0|nr:MULTISPECIES: NAD(P)-dependent alcohol dehydrogenase [Acinetobacter]SSR41029.1 putative NADP-dependent alcohol dehydrogenase [Acinetobacter baumannii]EXR34140.1 zinc-binding dehydrogenase family protein [Acinetobacter sp. 1179249]MBJ8464757.1 NAD(P)-dependent alcohol dehydrogenase [Acinetobacter nosocomialis]MBP1489107.1 NAD(P)-dependent alcohol dehydrogenase [Acinetobacter nosocomialis]MBP1496287.1 NAD(P)-dependent alcohol dehydrogenase [Acinetobacter nosocomialis]